MTALIRLKEATSLFLIGLLLVCTEFPTQARAARWTPDRSDVNANGSINATDVGLIKSKIGTGLP
jgi:hypothetical protein